MCEVNMLKEHLKKAINKEAISNALMFSGGIDSCIVYNLLKDCGIEPTMYCVLIEGNISDDYKSYDRFCVANKLEENFIVVPESLDMTEYFELLTSPKFNLNKRKRSSLLVVSLFIHSMKTIREAVIYTGLGSDAYYGLGRDFLIQCSHANEKTPSIASMQRFRDKTYGHYMQQYDILQSIANEQGKTIIAPFLNKVVFDWMYGKSFEECNKPKKKQILIDLYPEFFAKFKPRTPSNFQCGNSKFKGLLSNIKG